MDWFLYNGLRHERVKPMFHFHTYWKRQKNYGFLMFLVGVETEHWLKVGLGSPKSIWEKKLNQV